MMIFDYLIGNTDRHLLNYGMLYDTNTGEILGPAPIYDNGLSFFSWDEMPNSVSEVEDWIKENDLTMTFSDAGQLEEFLLPEHEEKIRKVSNLSLKPKFEIGFTKKDAELIHKFLTILCEQTLDVHHKLFSNDKNIKIPNT